MRLSPAIPLLLALALAASAQDTGTQPPPKQPRAGAPAAPAPFRQGGDTITDAVPIVALPFSATGTTTGYADDLDEACPYTGSTSPDVVYAFTPLAAVTVDVDMLGSSYDTKIYLYDQALNLVACNDDYYPDYVSRLRFVALAAGVTYYLVIDGYGGEHGDYALAIREDEPCVLPCPAGAQPEGEPPLVDDYEDLYNGGCNWPGDPRQDLWGDAAGELIFCGVAGWYDYHGHAYRDTDWFRVHVGDTGVVTVTAEAEWPTVFQDTSIGCDLHVGQWLVVEECGSGSLAYEGPPGWILPFFAGSRTFEKPGYFPIGNEYRYVLHFSGLASAPVPTAGTSWSAVKGMFR